MRYAGNIREGHPRLARVFERNFPKATRLGNGGKTRVEIGNMLDNFKTDILISLASHIDAFQEK